MKLLLILFTLLLFNCRGSNSSYQIKIAQVSLVEGPDSLTIELGFTLPLELTE